MGSHHEDEAVSYLVTKGYNILSRNYLRKTGEIDIVSKSPDGYLVAVEVKYRSTDKYGSPFSAVTPVKQKKIYRTLLYYMNEHNISPETACRFDVIGIHGNGEIEHLINAFEAG